MLIALTTASVASTVIGIAQWRVLIGLVPKRSPRLIRKFSPQDVISTAAITWSSSLVPGETSPRSSSRPTTASSMTPKKTRVLRERRKRERRVRAPGPQVTATPPVSGTGAACRLRPPGMVDQSPAFGRSTQHQDQQSGDERRRRGLGEIGQRQSLRHVRDYQPGAPADESGTSRRYSVAVFSTICWTENSCWTRARPAAPSR